MPISRFDRPLLISLVTVAVACGHPAPPPAARQPVSPAPTAATSPLPELPAGVEAMSLSGQPLRSPPLEPAERDAAERALVEARERHRADPSDLDAHLAVGHKLCRLYRYREAVQVYTDVIAAHPDDARAYRHRGHRFITLRLFARAVPDLERAATLRQGQPDVADQAINPAPGAPPPSLHLNIQYHLGLARYLLGDHAGAAAAYQAGRPFATTDDDQVALTYWTFLALARAGKRAEAEALLAPIAADMKIVENHAYHRLLRHFKGELPALEAPADPIGVETEAYGAAVFAFVGAAPGERASQELAARLEAIEGSAMWPAFGHIAAEADLHRLRVTARSPR